MRFQNYFTTIGLSSKNKTTLSRENIRWIGSAQIDLRARLAPRMAVSGSLVAAALVWSFWYQSRDTLLPLGFIGVFGSYATLFIAANLWVNSPNKLDRLESYKLMFALIQIRGSCIIQGTS